MKLNTWLAILLLLQACLAVGQAGRPAPMTESDKENALAALVRFNQRVPLLRPMKMDKRDMKDLFTMPPNMVMGRLPGTAGSHFTLHRWHDSWVVQDLSLEPYLSEMPLLPSSTHVLKTSEDAWQRAEELFSSEIAFSLPLERGSLYWQRVEGVQKAAVILTFKPKPLDFPIGRGCSVVVAVFRASDGALIRFHHHPIQGHQTSRILISKEKAIAAAQTRMLGNALSIKAQLAYMLPPYARAPGFIRQAGKPFYPELQLKWEVTSPIATVAVSPETGKVDWTEEWTEPPSVLHVNPSAPPSAESAWEPGVNLSEAGLLLQAGGFVLVFGIVALAIFFLMKLDRGLRT